VIVDKKVIPQLDFSVYKPKEEYFKAYAELGKAQAARQLIGEIKFAYLNVYSHLRSTFLDGEELKPNDEIITRVYSGKHLVILDDDKLVKYTNFLRDNWPKRGTTLVNSSSTLFDIKKAVTSSTRRVPEYKQHPKAGEPVVYKSTNKAKGYVKGEQQVDKDGNPKFYPMKVKTGWRYVIDRKAIRLWLDMWSRQEELLDAEVHNRTHAVDTVVKAIDKFEVNTGSIKFERNASTDVKPPDPRAHRWISLAGLVPLMWYEWPKGIDIYSDTRFRSSESGIGAGERWLGFLLGAQVQGPTITFDLAVPGEAGFDSWEVKEYDEKIRVVRLGSCGTDTVAAMADDVSDIIRQIKNIVTAYDTLNIRSVYGPETWLGRFVISLNDYIDERYKKIVIRGELGNSELRELQYVANGVAKMFRLIHENHAVSIDTVKVREQRINLTPSQYARMLYLVHSEEPMALSHDERMFAFGSCVEHALLKGEMTFDDYLHEWLSTLKPSDAFGNVKGVFLVNKKGFMLVPNDRLNDVFSYYRMSQGRRLNFKVNNIPSLDEAIQLSSMLPLSGMFEYPPVDVDSGIFEGIDEYVLAGGPPMPSEESPWFEPEFVWTIREEDFVVLPFDDETLLYDPRRFVNVDAFLH